MDTNNSSAKFSGDDEVAALLSESLERPLTRTEQQRLQALSVEQPDLAPLLAVAELIAMARAQTQIDAGEAAALEKFHHLLHAQTHGAARQTPVAQSAGWLDVANGWLTRPWLVGGCLAAQFVAIVLLLLRPMVEFAPERGVVASAPCSPFVATFDRGISMGNLQRILLQNNLRIVDGPDAQGRYTLASPNSLESLSTALKPVGIDISVNPACKR
jgi:hypothetical protein